jgi:hypothetical protein
MTTTINRFGEAHTRWTSNKHPENQNFMQMVNWNMWEKPDGKLTVCYDLGGNSKPKFIYGMTKDQVLAMYGETENQTVSEAEFEMWMQNK